MDQPEDNVVWLKDYKKPDELADIHVELEEFHIMIVTLQGTIKFKAQRPGDSPHIFGELMDEAINQMVVFYGEQQIVSITCSTYPISIETTHGPHPG